MVNNSNTSDLTLTCYGDTKLHLHQCIVQMRFPDILKVLNITLICVNSYFLPPSLPPPSLPPPSTLFYSTLPLHSLPISLPSLPPLSLPLPPSPLPPSPLHSYLYLKPFPTQILISTPDCLSEHCIESILPLLQWIYCGDPSHPPAKSPAIVDVASVIGLWRYLGWPNMHHQLPLAYSSMNSSTDPAEQPDLMVDYEDAEETRGNGRNDIVVVAMAPSYSRGSAKTSGKADGGRPTSSDYAVKPPLQLPRSQSPTLRSLPTLDSSNPMDANDDYDLSDHICISDNTISDLKIENAVILIDKEIDVLGEVSVGEIRVLENTDDNPRTLDRIDNKLLPYDPHSTIADKRSLTAQTNEIDLDTKIVEKTLIDRSSRQSRPTENFVSPSNPFADDSIPYKLLALLDSSPPPDPSKDSAELRVRPTTPEPVLSQIRAPRPARSPSSGASLAPCSDVLTPRENSPDATPLRSTTAANNSRDRDLSIDDLFEHIAGLTTPGNFEFAESRGSPENVGRDIATNVALGEEDEDEMLLNFAQSIDVEAMPKQLVEVGCSFIGQSEWSSAFDCDDDIVKLAMIGGHEAEETLEKLDIPPEEGESNKNRVIRLSQSNTPTSRTNTSQRTSNDNSSATSTLTFCDAITIDSSPELGAVTSAPVTVDPTPSYVPDPVTSYPAAVTTRDVSVELFDVAVDDAANTSHVDIADLSRIDEPLPRERRRSQRLNTTTPVAAAKSTATKATPLSAVATSITSTSTPNATRPRVSSRCERIRRESRRSPRGRRSFSNTIDDMLRGGETSTLGRRVNRDIRGSRSSELLRENSQGSSERLRCNSQVTRSSEPSKCTDFDGTCSSRRIQINSKKSKEILDTNSQVSSEKLENADTAILNSIHKMQRHCNVNSSTSSSPFSNGSAEDSLMNIDIDFKSDIRLASICNGL